MGLYNIFHSVFYRLFTCLLFRGKEYDTIVSFMEGEAVRLHSYLLGKSRNNVSWVHIDFQKKHWSADFFWGLKHEESVYSKFQRIVFVSEDAKDSFGRIFPRIDADKYLVIHNLIDRDGILSQSSMCDIQKDRFTICMVGRLNHQKRYDRALRLMKALRERSIDAELWIVGTGELYDTLVSSAAELGVLEDCRFWGFVKPPYSYMKVADIYLNTSEAEGYPLVICEALCLGLPVVATDITGAHEILDNSKFGLLVQEDDESIIEGVERMIADDCLRESYAKKARERSEFFSVQRVLEMVDSVL